MRFQTQPEKQQNPAPKSLTIRMKEKGGRVYLLLVLFLVCFFTFFEYLVKEAEDCCDDSYKDGNDLDGRSDDKFYGD